MAVVRKLHSMAVVRKLHSMAVARKLPRVVRADSDEAWAWIGRNWISLAGTALIAASLWLKAHLLAHAFFRENDFVLLDTARTSGFGWRYLTTPTQGRLMPGGLALAWLEARMSLYDWTLASLITLALLLAGSYAMFRLLRTLFGRRPALLVLLALFLFSPLTMAGLTWWTVSLAWVPLQLALCLALDAHIRHVRGASRWHAGQAAVWMAVGMSFSPQGVVVPLLAFMLTSAFLAGSGNWLRTGISTARRFWPAWLIYGAVTGAYIALFVATLPATGGPAAWSGVPTFGSTLLRMAFVPGVLGVLWSWWSVGDYAVVSRIPGIAQATWEVAAIIVAVSLWYRRRAWRAWVILAAWLILADVVLVVVGLGQVASPALLGLDSHYLADCTPVLALCIGLAFLPAEGEPEAY